MANDSTIKLYYTERSVVNKEWELIPGKLLVVEDIASYLATKSSTCTTINNAQYIKNSLELSINVDLAQSYSQPKATQSYKYVSIQNAGELIHYYFVKNATWRSKSTVRLELVMDVLNTFEEGKDYTFKPNTKITREHKDRLTRGVLTITFAIGETISSVGSVNAGDTIKLYAETIDSDWQLVCTGKVIFLSEENLTIQVNQSEGQAQLEEEINEAIAFERLFQFARNLSNYTEAYFVSATFESSFVRKIDYINENINPVLQCGDSEGRLVKDKNVLNDDWYLLYRNQNDPSDSLVNPVDCFLIPKNERGVNVGSITAGRLSYRALNFNRYYWIRLNGGSSVSITLDNGTNITAPALATKVKYVIFYRNSNNRIVVETISGAFDGYVEEIKTYATSYITLNNLPQAYVYTSSVSSSSTISSYATEYNNGTSGTWTDEEATSVLSSVDDLDRTDAKHIKLIKLPYCPYDFTITDNQIDISLDDNWSFETITQDGENFYALKLNDLNTSLERNITEDSQVNPFSNFEVSNELNPSINDLRETTLELESKLFHSEFFSPQLVYDSFAFKFDLEKVQQDWYYDSSNNKLSIKFIMTRTINSKFMFEMTSLKLAISESNYAKYLPIARNNEEVLYNVPYINYVRSGYNYDVKNKNTALASNIAGLGLSAASFGLSMALPSVSMKVAGIIASVISMANSVKSTIVSAVNNENSIRQKSEQYKNQAASVSGSDDVDLMSVYAQNRLKYLVYKPNEKMTNLLKDLFFYAGYNSGRMGLPNHNTRVNFDYLECDASLECLSSMPSDCVEELVNSLKSGITYLHKTNREVNKWDFEQKYENWERSLMED